MSVGPTLLILLVVDSHYLNIGLLRSAKCNDSAAQTRGCQQNTNLKKNFSSNVMIELDGLEEMWSISSAENIFLWIRI